MRAVLTILLALFAAAAFAGPEELTFVSPLEGQQVVGQTLIEITTPLAAIDRVEFLVDGSLAGVVRKPPFRIAHDFGTSLEPHTITARVSYDGYRRSATSTIRSTGLVASDSISVDLVEVPLRVHSSKRTVAPDDLEIRENGVVQKVSEVIAQRPPATFTFVVDRSLSMSDGKLDAAIRAIRASRSALREGDRAEVIFFNHTVSRAGSPGAIDPADVPPAGGTSLRDALLTVARDRRTIAIVISDGSDRNSFAKESDALRELSRANLTLHSLLLGRGNANAFLENVAERSGGRVIATSPSDLAHDLDALFQDINSRYTAVYQSRGTESGWRAISVSAKRRGTSVSGARKGYFAQ